MNGESYWIRSVTSATNTTQSGSTAYYYSTDGGATWTLINGSMTRGADAWFDVSTRYYAPLPNPSIPPMPRYQPPPRFDDSVEDLPDDF